MPRSSYFNRKQPFFTRLFKSQIFWSMIGLFILLLIVFPMIKNWQQRKAVDKEVAEIKQEIEEFENSNKDLAAVIDYLSSEQSVEDSARLNLGLKKPGEEVVVIKVEGEGNNTNNSNYNTDTQDISNYHRWFRYFFQ